MGKIKKRKEDKIIGKKMPSYYELNKINKENALKALEAAQKIKRPVKYLLKNKLY